MSAADSPLCSLGGFSRDIKFAIHTRSHPFHGLPDLLSDLLQPACKLSGLARLKQFLGDCRRTILEGANNQGPADAAELLLSHQKDTSVQLD
jgi:hypothetical protein